METLQQLVMVYAGVLVLNLALSALLWFRYRTALLRDQFVIWAASVVFLFTQAIPVKGTLLTANWSLPAAVISYGLANLLCRLSGFRIRSRLYISAMLLAPLLSVGVHALGAPFWAVALPASLAVALPVIDTPLRALLRRDSRHSMFGKALLVSVFALGLHDLDYPFLRDKPEYAVLGFTIALLIVFAISITAPGTILERVTEERMRAQEQNDFQRRFFANVTHELRTPLTIILSPIDSILAGELGPLTDSQRSYLEATWRNGVRLLKLINDLLDLAKLEEGFMKLRRVPTDVHRLLEDLVTDARPLAERKNLTLSLVVSGSLPKLPVDVEKLERVFVNLLSNAIKFTETGGVTVELVEKGSGIDVVVTDTGVGIPPAQLPHVFERFHQGDGSVTRRFGGTGIGLAYAREILQLHGGQISAESAVGKGSRFVVHLEPGKADLEGDVAPTTVAEAGAGDEPALSNWSVQVLRQKEYRFAEIRAPRPTAAESRPPIAAGQAMLRPRVLLVEDNVEILDLLGVHLRESYQVSTATDGVRGLEAAQRDRPDLIVTDYMMPEMDGRTMLRAIRADPQLQDVPVIMLSAKDQLADRLSGREAGADVYLTKPFSTRELEAAVHQLLQKHGRHVQNIMRAHVAGLEIVSAGLAHEIQNPLNFIKNAQHVIAESVAKLRTAMEGMPGGDEARAATVAKAQQKIGRMVESAGRGVQRIEDVVAIMRRYAREGFPTEPADVDLDQAVKEVVELVVPHDESECQATLDLATGGFVVRAIPEDLNQVIRSLVQNAVEASGAGAKLLVRTRQVEGHAILEVTDNGSGIASENLTKIFSPFYSTKPGPGRGLGLAIVQTVVDRSGGTVEVNSLPNAGTTFRVRLPVTAAAMVNSPPANPQRIARS